MDSFRSHRVFTALALAALVAGVSACRTRSEESTTSVTAGTTPAQRADASVLPQAPPPFRGTIGRTAKESKPDFPKERKAPAGAPNVLLIMTDDVGFGASSTFGGPISTPTFDALARSGLRYNAFHTTALCSPTRAALLTGRNHHSVGSGVITEMATGYPGYDGEIPASAATVAEVLRQNGYSTSWYGKNHNVPDWETSAAGPFDRWPERMGFETFYGFLGGDTNQWSPGLYAGARPIEPPYDDPTYILDRDLADHAIAHLRELDSVEPSKPFFVYYATGTAHAPHHAPKDWIAKYKGQFDEGWDKVREETLARQKAIGVVPANTELTPRPEGIPAWNSLSADQKRLYAHMMEVYAGALSHADYQIGRVIDAIRNMGRLDNTLVIFIQGDNGASAEGTMQGTTDEIATAANGVTEDLGFLLGHIDDLGGPKTYNHYPVGWAHAMDTPFQWTKQIASHFGGTRNGMVVSWPARIHDGGGLRTQFHHVIDVAPTIMEVAGIARPESVNGVKQKPVEGTSFAYTFDDASAPPRHTTQYFEMVGNRAIYKEGWIAATTPMRPPWVTAGAEPNPDDFKWELYDLSNDFSEAHDLAAQRPDKLKELQAVFDEEAKKYDVYPLDSSMAERTDPSIRPSVTRGRNVLTYGGAMSRIPEGSAPDTKNRSFSVNAEVDVPAAGAKGVLATMGGRFGGWGLVVLDGRPAFVHVLSNQPRDQTRIASKARLAPGHHVVRYDFAYDGGGRGKGGTGTLLVDGAQVATGHVERTTANRYSLDESFDVGSDTGTPIVDDYKLPGTFSGKIDKVTVELR